MIDKAKAIYREMLQSGPVDSQRVIDAMLFAGVPRKTYRAAKAELGIVSFSASRDGNHLMTLWALPDRLEAGL